jgi:hypothetical protein
MFTCVYPGRPKSNWGAGLTTLRDYRQFKPNPENFEIETNCSLGDNSTNSYHNTYSEPVISVLMKPVDLYPNDMCTETALPYCVFVLQNMPMAFSNYDKFGASNSETFLLRQKQN